MRAIRKSAGFMGHPIKSPVPRGFWLIYVKTVKSFPAKTVAKMMRRLGLVGICPKRWKSTTVKDDQDTYPMDLVKRPWDTGVLDQVRVSDITYLRT
jgi:hypothetical protein